MSLANLNKQAVSGKFRVADAVTAILSLVFAIYSYIEYGFSTMTYVAFAGVVISILLLIVNPAKIINSVLVKRQLK